MVSATEMKIMRNVVLLKCNQYNQGLTLFQWLKETLTRSLPPRSLENVQNYANKQTINNTCILTRQLGFEALDLATKHNFSTKLAERIGDCDTVCYEELKKFIIEAGDDWCLHEDALNKLLKIQLKENRLVLPSAAMIKNGGANYVEYFLTQRCKSVLYQLVRALNAKTSEKSFTKSKEILHNLLTSLDQGDS